MESEDKIEQWIDQALRQYGNVDAEPGFEARVLARVKKRGDHVRRWLWWAYSFAAVAAAVLLAALLLSHEQQRRNAPHAHRQFEDRTTKSAAVPSQQERTPMTPKGGASTEQRATVRKQRLEQTSVIKSPKLDQFPSPAPLSEQEQIMARYVSEHRQHAVMLARAETDLLERERRERSAQVSGSEQSISNEER